MQISRLKSLSWVALTLFSTATVVPSVAQACTRTLYTGSDGTVMTGRSMDWMQDMQTDLWAFPAGMARDGSAGPDSPKWVSKYGSVIASGYNIASADGMNDQGLVANMLYLAEANYGGLDDKPPMSIGLWAQYVLDNYATVAEAVDGLQAQPFRIVAPRLPNGSAATLHLSISDPTGDSAIFEYIDGDLVVHHGKQYVVMTNSPTYDQQLALNSYWEKIGGLTFLPGTNSAADRFARASFLIGAVPGKTDPNFISAVPDQTYAHQAVAEVMSVMRAVSVPLGITTPNEPNIASTLWRTVSDQKNKVYYFDSSTTPNTFWVDLGDLDLSAGAPAMKLPIAGGRYYSGNAAKHFVEETPFQWLQADPTQ
ncbi:linear amide C-N hydrolase [Microbaculum marinum]|uniref:Linear amide C-N hydrolase n=1 Tax=Microbaculum marinum TaxID=1764581 RepID=A0AAW9RU79_9HYPH